MPGLLPMTATAPPTGLDWAATATDDARWRTSVAVLPYWSASAAPDARWLAAIGEVTD